MHWHNEPPDWTAHDQIVTVVTGPKTDFWRKTHYGFIRDSGHFYFQQIAGDFVADVKVTGAYTTLYDQAGLMLRADETTWMKCGIEFVDDVQHASVVVTREYSDWSVLPLVPSPTSIWLRVRQQAGDIEVQYSLDGMHYSMLRVAHLTATETIQVGPMCASPEGEGFSVTFESFVIHPL
jgi:regulation of enolase protein 1 (concanavalin A-like superfamily)